MLFGITLRGPSSKVSLRPEPGFHLSNLAFEPNNPGGHEIASFYIQKEEDKKILVCSLDEKKPHHFLDLQFNEEDQISLIVKGEGTVHITGYYEDEEDEDESEDEEGSKSR